MPVSIVRCGRYAGRAVFGVATGVPIALLMQFLFNHFWAWIGGDFNCAPPAAGGAVLMLIVGLSIIHGESEPRGRVRHLLIGTVAGASVFGLFGAVIFPMMMTLNSDPVFRGKETAGWQIAGTVMGLPLGAVSGAFVGFFWPTHQRSGTPDGRPTSPA